MAANTVEVAYNLALADLLRQHGLDAQGEQRYVQDGTPGQVDVVVNCEDFAIVIEAEFGNPAYADANKRLNSKKPVVVDGLPVQLVVAIGYPQSLATRPESEARKNLAISNEISISYRFLGSDWTTKTPGTPTSLAEILKNFWVRSDAGVEIDAIVNSASSAIATATDILVKGGPVAVENRNAAATKSLIWLNAILFQELLAKNFNISQLPLEYRANGIPRPDIEKGAHHLMTQWIDILKINWWPIFHVAKETLKETPAPRNATAIRVLMSAALSIAEHNAIRRHDLAGRIFHRLLTTRKFLATNYTTIPAAIMLSRLAFEERWSDFAFEDLDSLSALKIVDPACGTGTLLMAAAQEVLKRARRAGQRDDDELVRTVIENSIYGFDVVPAAIHMAASTLCMSESRVWIKDMNLSWLRHDIANGVPHLGSLDFLQDSPSKGRAQRLQLLGSVDDDRPTRVTGTGEIRDDVAMPVDCDLVIANPPYTRAGGPGDAANTLWNPIFGSMFDENDARKMQDALSETLRHSPASMIAGLASAFLVLADERLSQGGQLAFVLPATALTGSRWRKVRSMLYEKYCIDWVIASHDYRTRGATNGGLDRYLAAFSESTNLAEVLIVATKDPQKSMRNHIKFVNLTRNPEEPLDAIMLSRKLTAMVSDLVEYEARGIELDALSWGTMISVPQCELNGEAWFYSAFARSELATTANALSTGNSKAFGSVPMISLGKISDLGPYHMQIKGKGSGLFDIVETTDPMWPGKPALWHHSHERETTLLVDTNARLERRTGTDRELQDRMLHRRGRLQLALELRTTTQKVAGVLTSERALGVSSWVTVVMRNPQSGKEEALCLWLNSTLGLLTRIVHGNRPYLGRSRLTHELAKTLPILNVDELTESQLDAARNIFEDLKMKGLQAAMNLAKDSVRQTIDVRLAREVLGVEPSNLEKVAEMLALEPRVHGGKDVADLTEALADA